ncbi:porin family protein [Ohtaekwangia koreensis]|uniref:Outer membrane protein beta-barrel domain-containing protein n=1 Tax=Ohtaekwangia koreensis TaxID=688867 RepID=A0A1T5MFK4_9BACT|nr:porin family protein [Ohtaekwangia koreensis]SKC87036.1 Outer membrane protein beta-barrel domain-containing protein [Ohtaekwangia koreensis]
MKRLLPFFILVLLLSSESFAQLTSCAQTLRLARSTYEQGRLHEIPALLEKCVASGFSQQEKVEAYKLLCLSYIYLEEPEKADEAMLNLLRTDHYFEINRSTDPAEFIALYNTFRTKPIYRIGGKLGVNASTPNVVTAVEANDGKSEYGYKIGLQFHFTGEIPFGKNLVLNPELGLVQRKFEYTNRVNFTDTTFTTLAQENQTWLSLPVSLRYQFNKIKFKPYIAIGVEADYLLSSSLSGSRTRKGYQFIEEKSFDITPEREKFNLSAILSAGAHFTLGGGYIITEVRFLYGITKINSAKTAFGVDSSLPFEYGYADSTYKLNSLAVTAGYVHNIFNPKKLNKRK